MTFLRLTAKLKDVNIFDVAQSSTGKWFCIINTIFFVRDNNKVTVTVGAPAEMRTESLFLWMLWAMAQECNQLTGNNSMNKLKCTWRFGKNRDYMWTSSTLLWVSMMWYAADLIVVKIKSTNIGAEIRWDVDV